MIITTNATGLRFSTDSTASDVSRFLSARAMTSTSSTSDRISGNAGFPASLERLYPSLYEVRSSNAPLAAVRAVVAKLATSLHLPAFGRSH